MGGTGLWVTWLLLTRSQWLHQEPAACGVGEWLHGMH